MDGGEGLPRADVVVADMEDEVESDAGPSPTTDTPPATTVTTTKEQPSQLARRACDVCNKRKLKCDKTLPTCLKCREFGWDCAYTRPALQPGPKRGYIQNLQQRIKDLESRLTEQSRQQQQPLYPSSQQSHQPMQMIPLQHPSQLLHHQQSHQPMQMIPMQRRSSPVGVPGLDQMLLQQQQRQHPHENQHPPHAHPQLLTGPRGVKPPPNQRYVELFFHYVDPFLPFIHKASTLSSLATISESLLFAMYAFGLRCHSATLPGPLLDHSEADHYFALARRRVTGEEPEAPTVATVQTLLLLSIYIGVTQDNYDTWILQSLAFRTAFLLGLNRPLPSSTDFVAQETRRRVWWFLYFCDRYTVSMGTDLRQQIDDEQCHVPMPCKESLWRGLSGPESYSPIRGKSLKNNGEGGPLSADFSSGPNLSAVGVSPTTAGVSPTNVITLINPAFAEFSQFEFQVSIGRLLAQIGDFNWREKKDRAWYNEEHLSLEKALQSWFVSLPGPVQHLGQSFSPEWSNAPNAHPHWSFVVIHILYNVAYLQLNYSRMMACIEKNASTVVSSKPLDGNGNPKGEHDKEEKDDKTMATYGGISAKVFPAEDTKLTNNGPGKPSVFKTCKAFQTCLIAARTIVQWTALVTKSNPLFLYLCRTTIYSRYQAALVLSVVLHHAVQDDPVLYSATMSDLDLLFRIFEAESRHSWITSVFVDKLRGLKADTALDFYV